MWNYIVFVTSASGSSASAPHTLIPAPLLFLLFSLYLILPAEFNLLPRVPSHNFFKSTFYETAIPFHRGTPYSKSYLQSIICGHINMTKVPVCSHVLCSCPHYHLLKHFIGYRKMTRVCQSVRKVVVATAEAEVSMEWEIKVARLHK